MPEEQQQPSIANILKDRAMERKMANYLKHLRRGRYALVLASLLAIPGVLIELTFAPGYDHSFMAEDISILLFLLVTFFGSRYWPYKSLLVATTGYITIDAYSFISFISSKSNNILFQVDPGMSPIVIYIAVVIRLIILFFLANGTANAWKFEQAEAENN